MGVAMNGFAAANIAFEWGMWYHFRRFAKGYRVSCGSAALNEHRVDS